jgi:hypothetical protein
MEMLVHVRNLVASLKDALPDLRALMWLAVTIMHEVSAVRSPLGSVLCV